MIMRDAVNEIVDAAIERNKDRVQFFSMLYLKDGESATRGPLKLEGKPFFEDCFVFNYFRERRLNSEGKIGEEVNFRDDDSYDIFYAGYILLDLGVEWFSARDGYICRPDQGGVRLARLVVYRFHWSFQRKEEIIEGLRDLFFDELYNFDLEIDENDENVLRWITEDFKLAENYTGDDVRRAFKPYDFADENHYSFSAYDPEALMDELIAARQFCANKGKTLSLTVNGGTAAEKDLPDKERVIDVTNEISDETLRKICSEIGVSSDHPVHLYCPCVKDAERRVVKTSSR